ncbi:ras-like protein [Anaeramoeba flamelloides]|uniref:Ras-like protein n=1 Tax=Anaeramoeba flamelloides TaxID=1746091 RepID=A0AAV7Z0R7_9EUKA|nr:ras-like protein [Anaeramoeba flamelloides]KAJ6230340.1 ras-like protein [Anaeramoeba flamelloides]
MSTNQEKHSIVLLGGGSVGKSCLTIQYLQGRFVQDYDPTVEESYTKITVIDNKPATLQLFDTAGQTEFRTVENLHLQKGDAFLLVFSLTSRTSFAAIRKIHDRIKKIKETSVPILIVGNKSDLTSERLISREDAEEVAKKISSPYLETSAKTGENVTESFEKLVRLLREGLSKRKENRHDERKKKRNNSVEIPTDNGGGCCTII